MVNKNNTNAFVVQFCFSQYFKATNSICVYTLNKKVKSNTFKFK